MTTQLRGTAIICCTPVNPKDELSGCRFSISPSTGKSEAPFELPGYWGSGKHASADGTKWNLYEQNLISEHHIRYGGYGGIGYYHVSDKFIALFSHFISCGTYEGTHILDGLMTNTSDIRPDTIHGDTQAQSYTVFALSHLLGIKLAFPRFSGRFA